MWIDVETDHVEIFSRLAVDGRPIDQAEPIGFAAKEQVGSHGEIVGQVQLLVDQRDAKFQRLSNRSKCYWLTIDDDLARSRRFDASDDPHQGALAGAVFADDSQHFAVAKRERDIVQCTHTGKLLADAAHLQQKRRLGDRHGRIWSQR